MKTPLEIINERRAGNVESICYCRKCTIAFVEEIGKRMLESDKSQSSVSEWDQSDRETRLRHAEIAADWIEVDRLVAQGQLADLQDEFTLERATGQQQLDDLAAENAGLREIIASISISIGGFARVTAGGRVTDFEETTRSAVVDLQPDICEHGIRKFWACEPCDHAAWEREKARNAPKPGAIAEEHGAWLEWITAYCGKLDPEETKMRFTVNEMRKAFEAGARIKPAEHGANWTAEDFNDRPGVAPIYVSPTRINGAANAVGCIDHDSILRCPADESCRWPHCMGPIPGLKTGARWNQTKEGRRADPPRLEGEIDRPGFDVAAGIIAEAMSKPDDPFEGEVEELVAVYLDGVSLKDQAARLADYFKRRDQAIASGAKNFEFRETAKAAEPSSSVSKEAAQHLLDKLTATRSALVRYGDHDDNCRQFQFALGKRKACDCGYNLAMEHIKSMDNGQ
jgi:hypothetical protein